MNEKRPLVSVRNLHKKFARDIKYNLMYGIKDMISSLFGLPVHYMELRKKEFWALSDINFDLYEGEILGVVGANGSGKTTMIRLISEIYPVDAGEIYTSKVKKTTPMFAISAGMQPLFTGRENIYIKGAMYGLTKKEIEAKLEFIESFSELGDRLDTPLGNYSSGMRVRLAFSIAIATDPDLFIIDEALAVGDSIFKAKCFDYLKEFVKKPGKGVLFVSNNIRKVLKVATRVLVMDKGKIVYNSNDVSSALQFYILNCLKHIDPEHIQMKLKKVQDYDM